MMQSLIEPVMKLGADGEEGFPIATAMTIQDTPGAAAGSSQEQGDKRRRSRQVTLDMQRLAAANIITPTAPRTRLADQFRVIKQPLIHNAKSHVGALGGHRNLVMVTSAVSGEGKTFTAINLAMSLAAEVDCQVMLVDADVSCSTMLNRLGLPPTPGLLDVLESRVDIASVLLRTNIDKLTLLPCGTPHARTTELLASDAMKGLLNDLASRYPDRIIVFDSPPLLLSTEAPVLASRMGQVVVVIRAGQTSQAEVQQALAAIEKCPLRMLVLNQMRSAGASSYGYGYGATI